VLTISSGAVFFDGYLPEWKIPTRLQRVCRTSSELKTYFLSHPTALPKPKHPVGPDRQVPLFPEPTTASKGTRLPPPAFAVQAILETLRQSHRYGPVTRLVPGEADPFCAEFARSHACVVLTSDSDLLVFDLGPDSKVAFLRDIEECNIGDSRSLTAQEYHPARISERLGLPTKLGLSALAFELASDSHRPLNELLSRSKSSAAETAGAEKYQEFMARYPRFPLEASDAPSGPLSRDLGSLDSRVSELVLQCLRPEPRYREGEAHADSAPGPDTLRIRMFLPQLLDSWKRVNAWETSRPLREVAYSLVQLVSTRRIPVVAEYARVVSTSSSGKAVEVPPVSHVGERCDDLSSLISRIKQGLTDHDLVWVSLAMYWDVTQSKATGKESVVLELLHHGTDLAGMMDPSSWNAVHWFAQIQSTYYSLRMLKQVVAFVRQETRTEAQQVQDLHEALALLPPLAGFPLLNDMQDLPSRLRDAGGLRLLADLTGLTESIDFSTAKRSKRKRGVDQPKRVRHSSSSATGTNPFAILGEE